MKKIIVLFIIIMLYATSSVFAIDESVSSAVSFGSDITKEGKENILKVLNINGKVSEAAVTIDDVKKYLQGVLSQDKLSSKSVTCAYVNRLAEGDGIKVETTNLTLVTPEMIIESMLTAGIRDISVKVASPYNVSGNLCIVPIVKAYEKITGTTLSQDNVTIANKELIVMSSLGFKNGMQKSMQFINEIKKEILANSSHKEKTISKVISQQEEKFGISLDSQDEDSIISIMNRINGTGLTLSTLSVQQNNVATYFNDLSKTALKKGYFTNYYEKFMLLLKKISKIFTKKQDL